MASVTDIVQGLTTPPLIALQQVLDTQGPYAAGDHVLSNFVTNGAFLLPAGSYGVSGTYGVIVVATVIPLAAGRLVGFNGIVGGQDQDEDKYFDRWAQLALYKAFPISGALYCTQRIEVAYGRQLELWTAFTGAAPDHIGLHLFPGWSCDLYYLCVL